ncbi:hypothetical protein [Edaphobacter aggregans]|uniref:hypothetical protein n=1 Tax=Edaphobacter aggregans TaxID=570835 RepID=UPI0005502C56|nr:hypothetical protein [Edaphobacter aggregans]
MKSSNIVTLFSEQPPPRTTPSSFLVSILIHGVAFGLLVMALRHSPRIEPSVIERYTVRLLNAPRIETQRRRASNSGDTQPTTQSASHDLAPGGAPAAPPAIPEQLAQLLSQPRVLVQPDAPPDLLLPQETPVPLIVMWSPENSPNKTIVPPPPQEATVTNVRPSFVKPNREPELADLNISATRFPSQTPTMPSSTSPLVVRGPEPVQQVPETAAAQLQQPTPARVLSLSDVQSEGPVVIPVVNQGSKAETSTSLVSPRAENTSGSGNGNPAAKQNGVGAGDGSGEQKNTAAAGSGPGSGSETGGKSGADQGSVSGGIVGGEASVVHITLPKDGQFGVVVVGSSLAEQYPETVGVWSGRLVYTVYLHIGLGKNWILQYTVPRSEEAAASGNVTRPEAPWPYDILRPNLVADDYTSEAIMVHGFVNLAGRFERLALVFPTQFAQAKFLLDALQQWQFRAARQNGNLTAVEVLLIIPEEVQ